MALKARYLADKSALARARLPEIGARLEELFADGLIATCAIVDLEVLYSARTLRDYEAVLEERRALEDVPVTPSVLARAIEVQHALARRGQHRVPIPDLIIAAAAELAGVAVLHYDADYELVAAVTGQAHEWVVRPVATPPTARPTANPAGTRTARVARARARTESTGRRMRPDSRMSSQTTRAPATKPAAAHAACCAFRGRWSSRDRGRTSPIFIESPWPVTSRRRP